MLIVEMRWLLLLVLLCTVNGRRIRMRKSKLRWQVGSVKVWSYNEAEVDKQRYRVVRQEAVEVFRQILNVNTSTEVTGHIWMFPQQAMSYHTTVQRHSNYTQICEVGFGCGLSSLGYLRANPTARLLTFDLWNDTLGRFGYDPVMAARKDLAAAYLRREFGDRWQLVKGDSYETIPSYFAKRPELGCDIIHIDGNHTEGGVLTDLLFFQTRARPNHIALIDDLQFHEIQDAFSMMLPALSYVACWQTKFRDLAFLGRKASANARKTWCKFRYDLAWSPGATFKARFNDVAGVTIPATMSQGNSLFRDDPTYNMAPSEERLQIVDSVHAKRSVVAQSRALINAVVETETLHSSLDCAHVLLATSFCVGLIVVHVARSVLGRARSPKPQVAVSKAP
ncbi:hypothetical protein DIPPA_56920 [Diplonema papillatum]|nr:hypothetical protein DIPPA_56920 [Diplonema papillatum]